MTFNKEDIELIRKFENIMQRGYYADGGQVTTVYNRVMGKNVNPTNCSSCLRGRISEMVGALNHFEAKLKAQDEPKQEEVDNVTPEENKANTEQKKRVGRPKKS